MCWSTEVSLAFTILDVLMGMFMCWRRRGEDVTYGFGLLVLAAQELFQFLLWWDGTLALATTENPDACSVRATVFSFGATYSAFSIVWVGLIRGYIQGGNPLLSRRVNIFFRAASFLGWMSLMIGITWAVVHTGTWCARVGPNHHQQWICALSLNKIDGGGLENFPWLLYIAVSVYGFSCLMGGATVPMPWQEFVGFIVIQAITSLSIYIRFWNTSEACSIWCWSAFTIGIVAVFRPDLDKYKNEAHQQVCNKDKDDFNVEPPEKMELVEPLTSAEAGKSVEETA
ncbi:expressed unknown protein [Seminavis robusta]|uniref:Uncharacterized protein n=1 Tax=Seminavis robusta TaxID=568900 RepID=A0A9N8DU07_9STRA|nr:expressed unknown protein [Seminavis robusta]|eukprot:Sro278_g106470.1 n/a (285) ;mRNA; r:5701-6555